MAYEQPAPTNSQNILELTSKYKTPRTTQLSYENKILIEDLFAFFEEKELTALAGWEFAVAQVFPLNNSTDRIILDIQFGCGGCTYTYNKALDYTHATNSFIIRELFTHSDAPNHITTKYNSSRVGLSPNGRRVFHLEFFDDKPAELWVYDFLNFRHTRVAKLKGNAETLLADSYGNPIKEGLIYWDNLWLHVHPDILFFE